VPAEDAPQRAVDGLLAPPQRLSLVGPHGFAEVAVALKLQECIRGQVSHFKDGSQDAFLDLVEGVALLSRLHDELL